MTDVIGHGQNGVHSICTQIHSVGQAVCGPHCLNDPQNPFFAKQLERSAQYMSKEDVEAHRARVTPASPDPRVTALEAELAKYRAAAVVPPPPLKLDLGTGDGVRKPAGFLGVDALAFPGVDVVTDLANALWPWSDASVDEVHCSHALEHIPGPRRIHFFNELYRVMKVGATARFITPHWASSRAYGDVSHEWPPVVPFFWAYLDRDWRKTNAPHLGFVCDFSHSAMIQPAPELNGRNQVFVEDAVKHWVDGGYDMHCTITKVVRP